MEWDDLGMAGQLRHKKQLSKRGRCIAILPGQYYDAETGLHYNWHRYYDPETGRYLTPDPIGLAGGINPFLYAEANPVSYIDPEGLNALLINPAISSGFGVGAAGINNTANTSDYIQAWSFFKNQARFSPFYLYMLATNALMADNSSNSEEQCETGDLTDDEIEQIQNVVDKAGRPLDVVGSAARGKRKEGSDIDYVVGPSSIDHYDGLQGDLPSIDPEHGIIPGTPNPHQGPSIRFEPRFRLK